MQKTIILLVLLLIGNILYGQTQNVNPDKNGEPWIVGGLRLPSQEEISKIPLKILPDDLKGKELPASFDNSTNQYFRPVFSQTHGSCAQASGVGYNFTYEINRVRGTAANITANQFPSHYTYNFLNGGSGSNGSWMNDGWEIIKASGCPSVETYGGIANTDNYWMSGYNNYSSGFDNRISEIFSINVGSPEGLETLKHWIYDHLDGSETGSVLNFAAGISNEGYQTSGYKVISWGHSVNHAMTFVGWDDNIQHDYNNDGYYTNDQDINNDGTVDMRDWEVGALIMVNSWGTSWMNSGKAYVMYKLLAESLENGGISSNKAYGINVKETHEAQLFMKVKMEHNSRNMIKVSAGVSENTAGSTPDYVINFPLFNKQGGAYNMRGTTSGPIEFALDITPLLNYISSGDNAKYFLVINEEDPYSSGSGLVYDFSVVDAEDNEYISATHNVSINNNDLTLVGLTAQINFDAPEISTENIPDAEAGENFACQLNATGGTEPYKWSIMISYEEEEITESFPAITSNQLTPTNDDDGYAVQSIDFDFPFYGSLYNEFTVSTDGSLVFEEGFEYLRTEEAIIGTKMIAVFASDLMIFPEDNDGMFYEGNENSATFRWKTSIFGDQNAEVDVALTLFPNGDMKFYYGNGITEGLNWASGISNGLGNYEIAGISGAYAPSNTQHKFSGEAFPFGMNISPEGVFEGIAPDEINSWNIEFVVTDNNNLSNSKVLNFSTVPASVDVFENNLISCFPNPFSEYVTFSYNLTQESNVNISLFDVHGKLMKTVFYGNQKPGKQRIVWYPNNIKNGIYFYKISVNNRVNEGKLFFMD